MSDSQVSIIGKPAAAVYYSYYYIIIIIVAYIIILVFYDYNHTIIIAINILEQIEGGVREMNV